MPKACIYAGFRHLFYQMALVWLYLWAGVIDANVIIEKNEKEKMI